MSIHRTDNPKPIVNISTKLGINGNFHRSCDCCGNHYPATMMIQLKLGQLPAGKIVCVPCFDKRKLEAGRKTVPKLQEIKQRFNNWLESVQQR